MLVHRENSWLSEVTPRKPARLWFLCQQGCVHLSWHAGRGLFGSHWLLILLAGAWKVQGVLLACLNPTTNSTSLGLQLIFEIQRDSLHSHVQAMYLAAFSPLCTHICTFPEVSLFLLTVPPRLCV